MDALQVSMSECYTRGEAESCARLEHFDKRLKAGT
jgi:hypothetical protein